ncbi:MAG: GntR family transcriptional regulator [Acidimicrobiia bacterium]
MALSAPRPLLTRHWIADELRRRMIAGELEPGEWVRQEEIATEFGTSHGPVREAFRSLASEGFIQHERNRGYRVSSFDDRDLRSTADVRELLETEAIRLAVPQFDRRDFAELQSAHDTMESLAGRGNGFDHRSVQTFRSAHEVFHFTLFGACGLPRLVRMIGTEWRHAQRLRSIALRDEADLAAHDDDGHQSLLDACLAGDVEGAVCAMRRHREVAVERSISALARRRRTAANDVGPR